MKSKEVSSTPGAGTKDGSAPMEEPVCDVPDEVRSLSEAAGPQPAISNSVQFPLCDAAVEKRKVGDWALADAIVEECSETGEDGVRNGSQAKMVAMREEIAKNHGVDLSLERIRKLRKVASTFPAGRRRPAASLEGHLEAGTPEVLDAITNSAPNGTPLTREYIRQQTHGDKKAERDLHKAEGKRQGKERQLALQNLCRHLERERDQREQRYVDLCRSVGKEPEQFSPPLVPAEPSITVAEDLEQSIRILLTLRGFDPAAENIKQAIADFVKAVLAQ